MEERGRAGQDEKRGSVRSHVRFTAAIAVATVAIGATGDAEIQQDMALKVLGMTGAWWLLGWMFIYEGWQRHILMGPLVGFSAAGAMGLVQVACG